MYWRTEHNHRTNLSRIFADGEPLTAEERSQLERERPKTRADCENSPRPCPFFACRYNLFLDVTEVGSIHFNRGTDELDLEDARPTCALDVAAEDGVTLDVVGKLLSVSRERVRQIQAQALKRVERRIHQKEVEE